MIDSLFRRPLSFGLSVALVALSSGMALAEDEPTDPGDGESNVVIEDGLVEGEVIDVEFDDDMIAWSGEVIDEYGAQPGEDGDVEYVVDETLVDPVPGLDDGVALEDDPVFVDSECGGCEYTTTDLGDRPVMINARGDSVGAADAQGWDAGSGVDPFARGNLCFSAETYVGFLCDWQRPFLGDLMP